jgi:hypothetical protein
MKGKARRDFLVGEGEESYFAAIACTAEARTTEQQAGHTPIGKNASGLILATVGASCDTCYASTDLLSFPAAGSPINLLKRQMRLLLHLGIRTEPPSTKLRHHDGV